MRFDIQFKAKGFVPPEDWERLELTGKDDEYHCYLPPFKSSKEPTKVSKSIPRELHPMWILDDLLDMCLTYVSID